MPIIKAKQRVEREQVRMTIDKDILEHVRQYCEWAGIGKPDDFYEQAIQYVLSKDKEWMNHLNQVAMVENE